MASIPVYLLTLSGKVIITYIAYKAVEKLTREYSWFSSSAAHGVPDRVHARNWFPSTSVAPVVSVDTGATVVHDHVSSTEDVPDHVSYTEDVPDHVSYTEDVPSHVSSSEDAPVSVETLQEEFRTVGLADNNKDNEDEDDDFNEDNIELDSLIREAKAGTHGDICCNYLLSGTCRNGSNCGYTHLSRKEIQAQRSASLESAQVIREKEKEDLSEKMEQQECKYYLRSRGRKFQKDCRYRYSREKPVVPPLDFNFLGLPIRPGERECLYYMRTGSCKYGPICKFHHPDPTAVGEGDFLPGSNSLHLSGVSQSASTSLSSPPNETVPCLDAANHYVTMMHPSQGVHRNPECNGYQVHGFAEVMQASLRPNGTQPLLSANRNPLGWNMPKTNPPLNGTSSKGAKKTKIEQSWSCKICKINCNSQIVLDNHKLGKKHKQNLEKLKESKKKASAPAAATAAHAAKHPAVGLKESPVADKGKTVVVQQSEEKGAPSLGPGGDLDIEMMKLMDGEAAANALWFCAVCNLVFISQTDFNDHLAGLKHADMVKKQVAAAGTTNPSDPLDGFYFIENETGNSSRNNESNLSDPLGGFYFIEDEQL
ncbi:hypothetical protein NE237_020057 [Protea cynaroides]|uniref:C3H1-type domain-containing protein n=1 Tax=Protea cynaroides TaxID=273540 RepID=A0A9Q0H9T7_9MAGN|nr:hypothetical protein NE237_020057 [Protea cynaroides]